MNHTVNVLLIYSKTSEVLWLLSAPVKKKTDMDIYCLCVWLFIGQINKWNYTNPVVAVDLFQSGAVFSVVHGEKLQKPKLILTFKIIPYPPLVKIIEIPPFVSSLFGVAKGWTACPGL